jgi:hypothetical protein
MYPAISGFSTIKHCAPARAREASLRNGAAGAIFLWGVYAWIRRFFIKVIEAKSTK